MHEFVTRPLYLQVHDALEERIAAGEWKTNTAVPNETDLAQHFGVSPGTMRKALDMLESKGIVSRRQGRGTFVNDPESGELVGRYSNFHGSAGDRVIGDMAILEIWEGPASDKDRERLQLPRDAHVCRSDRVRSHMATPFLFETATVPLALFPGIGEGRIMPSLILTARAYGIALGSALETVTAGEASPSASKALQIAEGTPVLVLDRIIMTRDGRPAEWRVGVCITTGISYRVQST